MYLKSLVLKGFKSFADRSVLALEPGITAIVGPNGSGKSNISDAVLWVLGERSARNLRGQAMEDIIFSGSAARRAVSVAEVDLVLDNSDHLLPVEFDEVVITRRMYRSGESEYLVNGVVSRRLDVLDILHDTGLGTGTHSIISQGSLDSILQSKTEDRRALIEEAAGILKHKRRKEKSARKLEAMDNHLARVRDVVAEVERQLGPLERKAKKAQAYAQAASQLHDKKLALAVDDLRTLQRQWDAVCAAEQEADADASAKRDAVQLAERQVNDYQEIIRRDAEDAGAVSRQHRRAASLAERVDGVDMLVRERRRAAVEARSDLQAAADSAFGRREAAQRELAESQQQLAEVRKLCETAEAEVDAVAAQRADVEEGHRALEERIGQANEQIAGCERDLEKAKRRHAEVQEALANGMAQATLYEERIAALSDALKAAEAEHAAASDAAASAARQVDEVAARESKAQEDLIARFEARDFAHERRDEARKNLRFVEAEIEALENALRANQADRPALDWALGRAAEHGGKVSLVSKAFRAQAGIERFVEDLLGDDLASLAVESPAHAEEVARALFEEQVEGVLTMVATSDAAAAQPAPVPEGAVRLVDQLEFDASSRPVVEALLGDVVLCGSRADAFACHARGGQAVRYASPDGCVIWPTGKVRVYGAHGEEGEGTLARERHLADLKASLGDAQASCDKAEREAAYADEAYRELQVETLKLSQQLANVRGEHEAAVAEEQRLSQRVESSRAELAAVEDRAAKAAGDLEGLKPQEESLAGEIAQAEERRDLLVAERASLTQQAVPVRAEATALSEKLANARLEAATLSERRTYVQRIALARQRDVERVDADEAKSKADAAVKGAVIARCDAVLDAVARIGSTLSRRLAALDAAVSASEAHANDIHGKAAEAREAARGAHDAYDSASERVAQVRVEKGRLEMRVEAAVATIVRDLGVPIDHAQDLPQLEDRAAVEDEVFKLERRIRNMGSVNPDAAAEYGELKQRFDYLSGQLSDMEAARASLRRIVGVIDARMKDDFISTFNQVNENFDEIFSTLFPGGTAHLSFEDPDDIDNSGVEVTAQPRGKRLTKMMLMSGGEKSLTALALLFAVYKTRATPFYILDEVEAALDDTNLRRLISYIDTLRESTQLIMITHQRRTMEMADVLFGVSMQADGVTKVISQKLERALEHAD